MEHRYSYSVVFAAEDDEYVATCSEIPGLSGLGGTPGEAISELDVAIEAWVDYLASEGLAAPEPHCVEPIFVPGGHLRPSAATRHDETRATSTASAGYEITATGA